MSAFVFKTRRALGACVLRGPMSWRRLEGRWFTLHSSGTSSYQRLRPRAGRRAASCLAGQRLAGGREAEASGEKGAQHCGPGRGRGRVAEQGRLPAVCGRRLQPRGPRLRRCNGEYGLGHTEQGLPFLSFFFFIFSITGFRERSKCVCEMGKSL